MTLAHLSTWEENNGPISMISRASNITSIFLICSLEHCQNVNVIAYPTTCLVMLYLSVHRVSPKFKVLSGSSYPREAPEAPRQA